MTMLVHNEPIEVPIEFYSEPVKVTDLYGKAEDSESLDEWVDLVHSECDQDDLLRMQQRYNRTLMKQLLERLDRLEREVAAIDTDLGKAE